MIAEIATNSSDTVHHSELWAGVIAVCTAVVIPFIRDLLKDRRERENDKVSQGYLKSIADSNGRLAEEQAKLNTHLQVQKALGDDRHAANISTMREICKFDSAALALAMAGVAKEICRNCENFKQKP